MPMTEDEWVERALDARVAQGLPRTVTDPDVLARIAAIIMASTENEDGPAVPRRRAVQDEGRRGITR